MHKTIATFAIAAVVAIGCTGAANAASHPEASNHSGHRANMQQLPHWLHWRYASKAETKSACGHTSKRGIIEWVANGDSSWLVCPNGAGMEPS